LAGKIPETAGFEDLLKKHRETEEKILYPELNKALSVAQKEIVIARINDVALKK
jgi:hemerythrin-like domain-containing protein